MGNYTDGNPHCACGGGVQSYLWEYTALVARLRPSYIQEWGPGPNTCVGLAAGAAVVTVEDKREYVPPPMPDLTIREFCADTPDYVKAFPADLYFVDARRRVACMENILDRAEGDVVMCLHDAQRQRYHEALAKWPYVRFLSYGFAVACTTDKLERMRLFDDA